ncbi:MAG: PaaI family thioesterase [Deferrisomatales bacterium]
METRNPRFLDAVQEIFDRARFVRDLGIELLEAGPGWCRSRLVLGDKHLQQHHYVHAGVQATLADHTAGAAATTLVGPGEYVLTIEFKVNLLHPAAGERLEARSAVIRPGRRIIVAESDVVAWRDGRETPVTKAIVTLAVKGG